MDYMQRLAVCSHDWAAIEEKAAGCVENGYRLYRCAICGQEEQEDLPSLGHFFGNDARFEVNYPHNEYQPCSNCSERYYTGRNCTEILNAVYDHITGQNQLTSEKQSDYDKLFKDGVIDIRDYNAFYAKIDKE